MPGGGAGGSQQWCVSMGWGVLYQCLGVRLGNCHNLEADHRARALFVVSMIIMESAVTHVGKNCT
jgi:hypothetical protein